MNNNEYKDLEKELLEDERISLFLQGKMNHEEESDFLEELKQNDELRQRATTQARLVKGMKQTDEELLKAFQQADLKDVKQVVGIQQEKSPARWLAVAASVVFIIFVGFKSYDYYDTTSLGKAYANDFPISTIIRGETNADVETELTTLFNKVGNAEDLDNCTQRLATLWEKAKQDTYNDYTDYAPYIGWYLAIGYLENYEKDNAESVLIEMEKTYPQKTVLRDKIKILLDEL